jgi:Flp pilus assembly protein TadB
VFFAGFSGAVLGLVVCLALGGLYVILRYIGEYLFYAGLTVILLSGIYLYVRRPADARRLRRFLADQGRRLLNWLWGRLRREDQVSLFL